MDAEIVIAGGGAGGLELAARLGRRLGRRVLLIDRAVSHVWKPSLHEVAAGSLDSHQEGLSYPLLARRNRFRFVLGDLEALDAPNRTLTLAPIRDADGEELAGPRRIGFSRLVLATGSGANLFGTAGAEAHAHVLEELADAEAFHRRLTMTFLAAAFSDERVLRIAIVGGGATGVELSSELIEGHEALMSALPDDQEFKLSITLIEASPRILGGLPDRVAGKARRTLEKQGVAIMTDAQVKEVRSDAVVTDQGEVRADLAVWSAGVKAPEINTKLGLETGKLNQFVVDGWLRTSAEDVFALGDCAQIPGPDGKPVPPRAQAASAQAQWLAKYLLGKQRDPYVYRDKGSLVSLGRDEGVGALMGGLGGSDFLIEGWLAKWAYTGLYLNHHRAVLGLRRTLLLALSRTLRQRASGRLKLH